MFGSPGRDNSDRSDVGFSLVEVMAALVIFALVSAGALTLVIRAATAVRGNQDRVLAASLAATEIDLWRGEGAYSVPLGRTERTVETESGDFLVTTDAIWATLGVSADPCDVGDGVDLEQSYLRLHVEVFGGDLDVPQTSDALLYPEERAPAPGEGTMTVQTSDSAGAPLSGVTVNGSNGAGSQFSQVTGAEGCVFIPDLLESNSWTVSVTKSGYRTKSSGGETVAGISVNDLSNTDLAFTLEKPGAFTVTTATAEFPLPAEFGFTYLGDGGAEVSEPGTTFPATVDDLWPGRYTAWLGDCSAVSIDSAATIDVTPGGTSSAALPAASVELVAPEGSVVTFTSTDSGCDAVFSLEPTGENLLAQTSLPFGTWQVDVAPAADPGAQTAYLAAGQATCSISWDVPNSITQEEADALAEASESPSSSPDPSTSPSAEPTPEPTILPEVSEPCPSEEPAP